MHMHARVCACVRTCVCTSVWSYIHISLHHTNKCKELISQRLTFYIRTCEQTCIMYVRMHLKSQIVSKCHKWFVVYVTDKIANIRTQLSKTLMVCHQSVSVDGNVKCCRTCARVPIGYSRCHPWFDYDGSSNLSSDINIISMTLFTSIIGKLQSVLICAVNLSSNKPPNVPFVMKHAVVAPLVSISRS